MRTLVKTIGPFNFPEMLGLKVVVPTFAVYKDALVHHFYRNRVTRARMKKIRRRQLRRRTVEG